MSKHNITLDNKLKKIKLIVLDVDGTLTDGGLILGTDHKEYKRFDVHDGYGIVLARRYGLKVAVITAKQSDIVTIRMQDLHIDYVYQNVSDKTDVLKEIFYNTGLIPESICYVGDELTDIQAMKMCGVIVAVANARDEVKEIADYITEHSGGYGAIRETVEMIFQAQGMWQTILSHMGVS